MNLIKKISRVLLVLVILTVSWGVLISFVFSFEFISINLIGNKDIKINVNDKYFENGVKSKFLNFLQLNNFLKITDNIDTKKLGKYYVKYSINFLSVHKNLYRGVEVVDEEAPVITLNGDKTVYIEQYDLYKDQGVVAIDNYEGDITYRVDVDSNVKTNTTGTYEVNYTVVDNSGNETVVKREVEVVESQKTGALLTQPVSKFRFDGYFRNIILEPQSEVLDQIDNAIFVGDSNIKYFYQLGKYLKPNQVFARNNLNVVEFRTAKLSDFANNSEITLEEALIRQKPKYLILSFGLTSSFLNRNVFNRNAEEFFEWMKKKFPEVKLIILSSFPVSLGCPYSGNQTCLNQMNYYVLLLCEKYDVKYINVSDSLKDISGFGKDENFVCLNDDDCGFHLSNLGRERVVDYIKHINLEG